MTIIGLLLVLIVIGFILYLVETYIPMPQIIKVIIYFVVAIFIIILLLNAIGINTGISLR